MYDQLGEHGSVHVVENLEGSSRRIQVDTGVSKSAIVNIFLDESLCLPLHIRTAFTAVYNLPSKL